MKSGEERGDAQCAGSWFGPHGRNRAGEAPLPGRRAGPHP